MKTVLYFIGAIIVSRIFCAITDIFFIFLFGSVFHCLTHQSLKNFGKLFFISGAVLPIIYIILGLMGMFLKNLVNGKKYMMIMPILNFVISIVNDFYQLFIKKMPLIIDDIGLGFWYYFGAISTMITIFVCYIICTFKMITNEID